jgi:L-iditol 2-dehydrogenase
MKALSLESRGVLALIDLPDPAPAPGEVRVTVRAAAVCGSDIHRYVRGHRAYPVVLGHEAAGVVDAVGEGTDASLLGRSVAIVPLIPDHTCDQCRAGRFSACGAYTFVGSRRQGAFAERLVVPAANVLPLPDTLPFEEAALIEPATVARHLLDLGGFAAGQTAIVLGAGSIGLMLVQWLRVLGASLIVATDVADENLDAARALGAHVTLNPSRINLADAIRERTGAGVDIALEASGSPQALASVVDVTRPRGAIVLGGNQPADASLPMSFVEALMRRELTLAGGFMSYSAPWPGHEWADSLAAVLDGGLDMPAMISHRVPLSEAPAVFAEIGARRLVHRKIVFDPAAR